MAWWMIMARLCFINGVERRVLNSSQRLIHPWVDKKVQYEIGSDGS